jgi:hypothetical protein
LCLALVSLLLCLLVPDRSGGIQTKEERDQWQSMMNQRVKF